MAFQMSLMLFTSLFFFFLPLHLSAFCSFSSVTKISLTSFFYFPIHGPVNDWEISSLRTNSQSIQQC